MASFVRHRTDHRASPITRGNDGELRLGLSDALSAGSDTCVHASLRMDDAVHYRHRAAGILRQHEKYVRGSVKVTLMLARRLSIRTLEHGASER